MFGHPGTHISDRRSAFTRVAGLLIKATLFLPFSLLCQNRNIASVNIPFQFAVGDQVMPSGQYRLVRVTENLYMLRQMDGSAVRSMAVQTVSQTRSDTFSRLTFHSYGDRYFFSGAWISSLNTSFQVPRGKAEKEVLSTRNTPRPDNIAIAIYPGATQK